MKSSNPYQGSSTFPLLSLIASFLLLLVVFGLQVYFAEEERKKLKDFIITLKTLEDLANYENFLLQYYPEDTLQFYSILQELGYLELLHIATHAHASDNTSLPNWQSIPPSFENIDTLDLVIFTTPDSVSAAQTTTVRVIPPDSVYALQDTPLLLPLPNNPEEEYIFTLNFLLKLNEEGTDAPIKPGLVSLEILDVQFPYQILDIEVVTKRINTLKRSGGYIEFRPKVRVKYTQVWGDPPAHFQIAIVHPKYIDHHFSVSVDGDDIRSSGMKVEVFDISLTRKPSKHRVASALEPYLNQKDIPEHNMLDFLHSHSAYNCEVQQFDTQNRLIKRTSVDDFLVQTKKQEEAHFSVSGISLNPQGELRLIDIIVSEHKSQPATSFALKPKVETRPLTSQTPKKHKAESVPAPKSRVTKVAQVNQAEIESLIGAKLAHVIPDTMRVDSTSLVSLSISVTNKPQEVKRAVVRMSQPSLAKADTITIDRANVPVETSPVNVSNTVKVTLQGDDNVFRIHVAGSEKTLMNLQPEALNNWKWHVTPLTNDRHPLTITVTVELTNGDINAYTFTEEVYILKKDVTIVESATNFMDKSSKWVLGIIPLLVGFFLFLGRKLFRKKTKGRIGLN